MGFADGALRDACVALLCVQVAVSTYYFVLGLRMLLAESLVCNCHMKGFTYLFFWIFNLVWAAALLGVWRHQSLSSVLAVVSICVSSVSILLTAYDQICLLIHTLPKEYGPVFFLRDDDVNVHWHGKSPKIMIDGQVVTSNTDVGAFHNAIVSAKEFTYGAENKKFSRVSHLAEFQVITDVHCGEDQLARLRDDWSGLTLNLGDMTSFGTRSELQWSMRYFSDR